MEQLTAFPEGQVRSGKPAVIAPDLQRLDRVSVWELKHHPENPRRHNLGKISESLRQYGQQTPIVVQRSTGYVCKGNGTLRAARDILGWDALAVSVENFDESTALRYLLADNEASASGETDRKQLATLLRRLDGEGGLQGTLFDIDEAETVWSELEEATTVDPGEFRGGYAETAEELAERAAKKETAERFREVVLALKQDDYEAFALAVSKLSRAYGTKGVIATVMEAIRRAADQVVA